MQNYLMTGPNLLDSTKWVLSTEPIILLVESQEDNETTNKEEYIRF